MLDQLLAPSFTTNLSFAPVPPSKKINSPKTTAKKNSIVWGVVAVAVSSIAVCLCLFIFLQIKTLTAEPVTMQTQTALPTATPIPIPTSTPNPCTDRGWADIETYLKTFETQARNMVVGTSIQAHIDSLENIKNQINEVSIDACAENARQMIIMGTENKIQGLRISLAGGDENVALVSLRH